MTPLLVVLYGFLAIYLAFTGYCAAQVIGSPAEDETSAELPLPDPTPLS